MSGEDNIDEKWRRVEGYEKYFVSNMGNIATSNGVNVNSNTHIKFPIKFNDELIWVVLKVPEFNNKNAKYFSVKMGKNKSVKFIHDLVCSAFNDHYDPSDMEVHHKNHNRFDNRLSNLDPLTKEEHIEIEKKFKYPDC